MTEEANEFISALETRHGGKVGYRTYSTWFAASDGTIRTFGVFVYQIDTLLHFEDFERNPSLFGIPLGKRKNQPKYEKYEGVIDPKEIESITQVGKKEALAAVLDGKDPTAIQEASRLQKIFSSLVTRVMMRDGRTYFFEMINHKEFIEQMKKDV